MDNLIDDNVILAAISVLVGIVRSAESLDGQKAQSATLSTEIKTTKGETELWEINIQRAPESQEAERGEEA